MDTVWDQEDTQNYSGAITKSLLPQSHLSVFPSELLVRVLHKTSVEMWLTCLRITAFSVRTQSIASTSTYKECRIKWL